MNVPSSTKHHQCNIINATCTSTLTSNPTPARNIINETTEHPGALQRRWQLVGYKTWNKLVITVSWAGTTKWMVYFMKKNIKKKTGWFGGTLRLRKPQCGGFRGAPWQTHVANSNKNSSCYKSYGNRGKWHDGTSKSHYIQNKSIVK